MSLSKSSFKQLKKGIYEENIASSRIIFCTHSSEVKKELFRPLILPLDKTKCLADRLVKRKIAYESANVLRGYTIQIYMGSSRTAALKAQDLATVLQSIYVPELHYRQPNYTVRIGFFSDRLEAYFVYLTLVQKLSGAMIRPFLVTRTAYLACVSGLFASDRTDCAME